MITAKKFFISSLTQSYYPEQTQFVQLEKWLITFQTLAVALQRPALHDTHA